MGKEYVVPRNGTGKVPLTWRSRQDRPFSKANKSSQNGLGLTDVKTRGEPEGTYCKHRSGGGGSDIEKELVQRRCMYEAHHCIPEKMVND